MESASSSEIRIPEGAFDLSFGFNDPNYSDRTLLLEIIDAPNKPPILVKTIHVTSLILAARSPIFRQLMQESDQKHVTLRIEDYEETSFMDLLKYVYCNNLPTSLDALWELLLVADKFVVDSCLRDCARALQNFQMTCELASYYLNLHQSLLISPTVRPLIDAAMQFLVMEFQDLQEFNEEVLDLPLLGLQAILSSDNLQVLTEICVYDYVMGWARRHYPDLEERREILKTHLLHLVRFPFMTTMELTEEVQDCSDIDPELASEIVIRALSFKAEANNSHRRRYIAAQEVNVASRQFVERAYIYRPVKVVALESPHPYCAVYLDLTRNELNGIFPDGEVWSDSVHLGEQEFCLGANCTFDAPSNRRKFGLTIEMLDSDDCTCGEALDKSTCTVKYEFSVRRMPHEDFKSWLKGNHTFTETWKILRLPVADWARFLGYDSSYFVNGVLHVRAELSIKK